jgi:hypothetical protein
MRVFGKPFSEYVRFAGVSLALIAGVALLRLVLSLAGVADGSVRWISATAVTLVCALVWSARVHTTGFGSYRQVLPVVWLQTTTLMLVIVAAIVLAIVTGRDNIFTVPEYSGGGDGKTALHAIAHVVVGCVIEPLILWALGSLVLLVTKKVAPRPAGQRQAA